MWWCAGWATPTCRPPRRPTGGSPPTLKCGRWPTGRTTSPAGKASTMGSHDDPNPRPAHLPAWWEAQWAAVPDAWRRPVYRIDAAPANSVFLQNRYYLREHRGSAEHNFSPPAPAPARFADEVAWWVWLCHHEGLRKIEPSLLKWAGQALAAAAADYRGPARLDPAQHQRPVRRERRAPGGDRLRAAQRPAALGG